MRFLLQIFFCSFLLIVTAGGNSTAELERYQRRSGFLVSRFSGAVKEFGAFACPKRKKAKAGKSYKFASDECCNEHLERFLKTAIQHSGNHPKLGAAAKLIQRFVQRALGVSIEMVVSSANFAISTYYQGDISCRVRVGDKIYALYATPKQYDINNSTAEDLFAGLDSRDPLGERPIQKIVNRIHNNRMNGMNNGNPQRVQNFRQRIHDFRMQHMQNFQNFGGFGFGK